MLQLLHAKTLALEAAVILAPHSHPATLVLLPATVTSHVIFMETVAETSMPQAVLHLVKVGSC